MFRSRYDSDATIFNPEGKILQVELAAKAVQQGMPSIGIKSKTHVVLAAKLHAPTKYSEPQPKIFKVSDNIGVSVSGLSADGRGMCKFLREQCLENQYIFGTEPRIRQLAELVAVRSQAKTQVAGKRPYGVGLLIAGYDESGPSLIETSPSGQFWEYKAQAIGHRSQAAKSYLEQHVAEFPDATREQLIGHAVKALMGCLSKEKEDIEDISLAIIGKDEPFRIFTKEEIAVYLNE